ncbi:Vacuolar protein sorting-associated protein 8-like [Acipenser ruthenus]|uniref:Vacuolar protein sorting-associated protein 8-like n=1 Tax=Acipenser ruthenus TaxID=7906 RepID=A0A662YV61_ACIRT|nr:Vacuolar protein sorting-associated protein 8-like [Acipenser ruthenus]
MDIRKFFKRGSASSSAEGQSDPSQVLKLCLGSTSLGAQYGAISALSLNNDCTQIVSGFTKGQILQWDLETGKLLRTITNVLPHGTTVLNIKFTDDPSVAVCSDSTGSVFELSFKRSMGTKTCEARCLFSSDKGQVCCVEPLRIPEYFLEHPAAQYSLVAMVSLKKTDPYCVPVLAWHFMLIKECDDPVLAFCRGSSMTLFHVKCTGESLECVKIMEANHQYDIVNVKWMNSQTLLLIDPLDKLHVLDRESQEEMELLDLSDMQLIHTSSFLRPLTPGEHISPTLRINFLVKQDCFAEALGLAWVFFNGTAKAVFGRDLLFGEVYDKLNHNAVALGVLFECLEPYILADRLKDITPLVVKELVVYYENGGMLDALESLITHLDITTLDLHQIVLLTRKYKLFDALIYVYNKGMNDFITPIEVFSCLTRLHSKNADPDEGPHPYIRTLLKCNTREFLNVLALTFEDMQQYSQAVEFLQIITDVLLKVMLESVDFTPSQIGCLFTFLARQIAKTENALFVNMQLFDQALLELLQAGGAIYFDEDKLLSMAEKMQFYQICEFVYEERRLYTSIVGCYLKDAARRELLTLSPNRTAMLILQKFQDSIPLIMETLQQIVQKHQVYDALAFLLEMQGNIQGAFSVLLEELWFPLLDLLMSPAEHLQSSPPDQVINNNGTVQNNGADNGTVQNNGADNGMKALTKDVLEGMAAYIPLTDILQRLIQDPVYSVGNYGEIKGIILGMLDTFVYEKLSILTELARQNSDGFTLGGRTDLFQQGDFQLKLAPPPLVDST